MSVQHGLALDSIALFCQDDGANCCKWQLDTSVAVAGMSEGWECTGRRLGAWVLESIALLCQNYEANYCKCKLGTSVAAAGMSEG